MWREEPNDAQLGQILFYLAAQQLNTMMIYTHPPPIMGMFMADGNVRTYGLTVYRFHTPFFQFCSVVATVDRNNPSQIIITIGEMRSLNDGAIITVLDDLFSILMITPTNQMSTPDATSVPMSTSA